MKPIFLFIALNLSSLFGGEYWQQLVRYQMDVKLDTAAHTIGGHSTIKYVNNSPNELDHIYINLYSAYHLPDQTRDHHTDPSYTIAFETT